MKAALVVLLAALIGLGAGWFLASERQQKQMAQLAAAEAAWQGEKAFLEQALREARQRPGSVRTVTQTLSTTATNRPAPGEILQRLLKLNPTAGEATRNRVFRQIVHHLQTLVEWGPGALPVIQGFLKENKDVDFSSDALNESGDRVSRSGFQSRNITRTDFLVPPSLRLGLVDVLDQIGGETAQGILAEVLESTGRGVEVAYIARVLQEEAPDKYREMAIQAAKELLTNPPAIDQPNRLDDNARAYLYGVLSMFGDKSFTENARQLLLSPEGKVDKQALAYLNSTLKEQSVPALYAAYKDPRLTNQTEKATIMNAVLNHAGPSAQANELFQMIITDDTVPAGLRAFTIQGLAGGAGREKPSDAKLIESRLGLLQSYRGSLKDERLLRAIDETKAALELILSGQSKP
ncbi:MAG TPA: hypothetical protein VNU68_14675 [Verrucomicrobiae bacterium]|nr:hypothetical protein [Verrucomicrobiae bacterium]